MWVVTDGDAGDVSIPDEGPATDQDTTPPPDATPVPDQDGAPDASTDMTCVPETDDELCTSDDATFCGILELVDRCGTARAPDCGACDPPQVCGDDNVCRCEAETDAELCARLSKDCGMLTAPDNCGVERSVECGMCEPGIDCGSDSPNVCGCPCNIGGECYPADAANPANPCEVCDPAQDEGAWTIVAGASCDDGDACTTDDVCDEQAVCAGVAKNCACDGPDADHCAGLDEQCNVGMCDPANGNCVAMPVTEQTPCTLDDLDCTVDVCVAGTCTADLDPAWCLIAGTCHPADASNGPCRRCDPAQNQQAWTITAGAPCDSDALTCTSQTCAANGACQLSINEDTCLVGGTCYDDGDPNPADPCAVCDADADNQAFSPESGRTCDDGLSCTTGDMCMTGSCGYTSIDAESCLIGGLCYADGDPNPSGSLFCLVCDADEDQADWSRDPDTCFIDGECVAEGETNGDEACQVCDPSANGNDYTDRPNGTSCGTPCSCSNGRCRHPNGDPC